MDLLLPNLGLIVWTSLAFIIVWGLLGKMAWKPIVKSLKEREQSIEEALSTSAKAREEVKELEKELEKMKVEARQDREQIVNDARAQAKKVIAAAEDKAQVQSDRIVADAQEAIQNEKKAALAEVRQQVASLSLEIAEKVLRKNLENSDQQQKLVSEYMTDLNLN